MSKSLTAEEKEAKKQAAAEKAARDAEEKVAAEETAKKEAEEQASREAAEKAAAEEKAVREAEEQAAAEEAAKKEAEEQAKAAGAGAEAPPSTATSYANNPDDKAQRDAENATKGKKGKEQPADAKTAELKAKGLEILADYPAEHTVYMTANGFGFFKRSDARNHADTLSDTEILTVNKE